MAELSPDEKEAVRRFVLQVELPKGSPGKEDTKIGKIYATWYRRGYAYAYVTVIPHTGHAHPRPESPRDAMLGGWFAGNRDGDVARQNESIDNATEDILRRIKEQGDRPLGSRGQPCK